MNTPTHATINVGEYIDKRYFAPPSTDERPATNVTAFWRGKQYIFKRSGHNEPWKLLDIQEHLVQKTAPEPLYNM